MKTRKQIATEDKWDLSKIFSSDKKVYEELEELKNILPKISTYKGQLGEKDKCLEFFKLNTKISQRFAKLNQYAYLNHSEDLEVQKYVEMMGQISTLAQDFSVAGAFSEPELSRLPEEYITSLIEDSRFKTYKLGLINLLRQKSHILSEEEEVVISKISQFADGFSDIFDNFDSIDIKLDKIKDKSGEERELNTSNYILYAESKDEVLRENAFKSLYKGFISMVNTLSTNYINSVKADVFYSDVYKYTSTLDSALFGGNISEKVYTNLIDKVNKNLNLLHRYYEIKKRVLNLPDFRYCDTYVSIADISETYTFAESMEIIKNALKVLGEDYIELLNRSVKERWMDIYPNKNKATGAFCYSTYEVTPFVLLNTVNNLDSIFTIAHELGHAMHSYYSNSSLPCEIARYPIFLAEIASTTNEVLLIKYFFSISKTKQEKIYFLDKYLKMFKSTLFRQTMFSEFEDFAHKLVEQKKPISKEILRKFYGELNKRYHGKAIKHCSEIEYEWLRIPHFYNSYYVYKYATGITSAIVLANKMLKEGNSAVERYKEFLKSGGSDYPTNILKRAGVDLEKEEPYKIAFGEMLWALEELEKLV